MLEEGPGMGGRGGAVSSSSSSSRDLSVAGHGMAWHGMGSERESCVPSVDPCLHTCLVAQTQRR